MKRRSRQGFVLSVVFHVLIVAGSIAFALFQPPKKPERTVFELVSRPAPSVDAEPQEASSVDFTMPRVAPPPPVRPIPVPVEQPPPPRPTPQPVQTPPRVPTPTPTPKREEPPPPKPTPQLSYEEYVKQHGAPRTPTPRQTQTKPIVVPRLNTQFTTNIRENYIDLERMSSLSDAELSAIDRYIARLKEALRRAWDKPTSLADSLATVVEFDVAANGRLSGVKVTKGSGNRQFDDSVVRAFTTLGSAGATPDGRPQQLRLTFRMTDQ
ncbi:TonB family protein [Congregicoccus parvus]|uniref:TonB family protein n=1 Tax=Congregicoccus parvus TaxID=3081749 RepID=UPI003FA5D82F